MQKSRKTREKSASEILVYGFIVARVNRKSEPEVEAPRFATAARAGAPPEFPIENQCDRAQGRRLTPPQGAIGYDGRNEGNGTKKRRLAEPYSGAPRLTPRYRAEAQLHDEGGNYRSMAGCLCKWTAAQYVCGRPLLRAGVDGHRCRQARRGSASPPRKGA